MSYYLAALTSPYIGDVRRFSNADKLAVFFGIVPQKRLLHNKEKAS
ncbi:MAG: hypothetical protein QXU18_14995 [Thermoplasmatales archaeon]